MEKDKNRIQSLDGLRAVSIMMVLFSHGFRPKFIDFGGLGVKIFFVISSYLIVGILLNDINKERFSLKKFYFKRVLRTFPVYYFYLIITASLLYFLQMFEWSQFWRAPVYLANYHARSDWKASQWFFGHSWSLAVEEQFYLVIAGLFFLVNGKIISVKKSVYILIAIVLLIPIIRVCYLYFDGIPEVLRGSLHRSFETVADSLAIGGLVAILEKEISKSKIIAFFNNKVIVLYIIVLLLSLLNNSFIVNTFGYRWRYLYCLVGISVINVLIGIIMVCCIHFNDKNSIFKFLNSKIMITIGLWSYSIYIWQQVWLYSWQFSLAWKFLGILVCTVISYYYVELPFLRFRDNYLARKTIK